jgi:hypothetical protein
LITPPNTPPTPPKNMLYSQGNMATLRLETPKRRRAQMEQDFYRTKSDEIAARAIKIHCQSSAKQFMNTPAASPIKGSSLLWTN